MKFTKASVAVILACALALGLFACAPDEEGEKTARTPFAAAQSDPLVYLNAVIPLLKEAEGFAVETSYGMDDIKAGNDTLQEARNVFKNNIIDYINSSYAKERDGFYVSAEEALMGMIKRDGPPADMEKQCPALFNALEESDLLDPAAMDELIEGKIAGSIAKLDEDIGKGLVDTLRDEKGFSLKGANGEPVAVKQASGEQKRVHVLGQLYEAQVPGGMLTPLKLNEVLELRVAERLKNLEADIEQGRNSSMKNKTDEEKREYVLTQLGESAVKETSGLYQIDGKLALEAADKFMTPADKADILAQLAKAGGYLAVEDYALEPTEFTLFAQVNKAFLETDGKPEPDPALSEDMLKELKLEIRYKLTATATGVGAFEGEGEFPITLTLRKTVKYKDIKWKAADENA